MIATPIVGSFSKEDEARQGIHEVNATQYDYQFPRPVLPGDDSEAVDRSNGAAFPSLGKRPKAKVRLQQLIDQGVAILHRVSKDWNGT